MDLIVKEATEMRMTMPTLDKRYELFTTETVKDINDIDVQIPRSIGRYSLADLQREKEMLENQLDQVNSKIEAITAAEDSVIK